VAPLACTGSYQLSAEAELPTLGVRLLVLTTARPPSGRPDSSTRRPHPDAIPTFQSVQFSGRYE